MRASLCDGGDTVRELATSLHARSEHILDEVENVRNQDREAGRPPSVVLKKLARALDEFATYIDNNSDAIVNYGERYRCGERLSTGFVESAVNQVVAKRFMKKQQMRWTRAEPLATSDPGSCSGRVVDLGSDLVGSSASLPGSIPDIRREAE